MNRRHFLMGGIAAATAMRAPAHWRAPMTRSASPASACAAQGSDHIRRVQQDAERRDRGDLRYRRIGAERAARRDREGRQEAARRLHRSSQAARRQIDRRRSRSPRRTTTTRCRRSGPARRARTCTSRSRARTICSRRGRSWRPRSKYNRMVQHGTNSRSGIGARSRAEDAATALIGDVYMARGLCFKWRDTIGRKPVEPVPAGRALRPLAGPGAAARVHRRIASTTTGTGSGTTATATSATRASTRWTWRAGAWA